MQKRARYGKLSVHTENIFPIIKKWLYSEHDIFLRELISNAIDAMQKRKAINPELTEEDLKVEIKLSKKEKSIQVIDYGIGMTAEEIKRYINQIAFSGAEDFIQKFKDKQSNIIGHFGLGFYSSFMVADKVTLDSLSYEESSQPAYWECSGETRYKMDVGKRKQVGTTVTVYLNKENEHFLDESKLRELVEKYSNFLPFPIYIGKEKEPVNMREALWNKKPNEVKDEEYKEFYKKLFHDYNDPLFWIHLNVDFPFNIKGILYFPKIRDESYLMNQGKVKLYCHNVFVADDLKDIIPEFLLLLRGGIDIPDIPLNVSRSFLQQDTQVKKMNQYIIKKVAESLNSIFKEDRKKYEGFWEDINHFIKYGVLLDDKFYESMNDIILFKTTNDDYVTLNEYLERNKRDEKPQKIYYAGSENLQVTYLNLMKEQGIEVVYVSSPLDTHLFQHLEMKKQDINFVRIDSEINENLLDKDKKEIVDSDSKTASEKITELFNKALNPDLEAVFDKDSYAKFIKEHPEAISTLSPYVRTEKDFTYIKPYDIPPQVKEKIGEKAYEKIMQNCHKTVNVESKHIKSKKIPAMVVFNEFIRRYHDMNYMQKGGDDFLQNHILVVNPDNELIKKIIELDKENKTEQVETLAKYIHELALLEQKQFSGKELKDFLQHAHEVLDMIK